MGYPKQEPTVKRLMALNYRAFRRMEETHLYKIERMWRSTRTAMRHAIAGHIIDSSKTMAWASTSRHVLMTIVRTTSDHLNQFRQLAERQHMKAMEIVRHTSLARQAWLLRSVIPPNKDIVMHFDKSKVDMREADQPPGASVSGWADRFDGWLDAWQSALQHNLNLNMINGGSASDAADEVDATTAGTPRSGLWDAIDRLFRDSLFTQYQKSNTDVMDANDEVIDDAIYHAYLDSKVCDDCADNDGGLRSDLGDDAIPVHPYCRCQWMAMPQPWSKMLSEDDRKRMEDEGIDPDAMVVFDADGKAQAVVSVTFPNFVKQQAQAMSSWGVPVKISRI
jgi:hypothetical protein